MIRDIKIIRAISDIISEKLNNGPVTLKVNSHSMSPFIKKGDLVKIQSATISDLQPEKDIICFLQNEVLVIHRLINIKQNHLVTKGDANLNSDIPLSFEQLRGKVTNIIRHNKELSMDQGYQFYLKSKVHLFLHQTKKLFQTIVLKSSFFPCLQLYRLLYTFSLLLFRFCLKRSVKYSRFIIYRSFADSSWLPGRSDIDIILEINTITLNTFNGIRRYSSYFPLLGGVAMMTPDSLEIYRQYGGFHSLNSNQWIGNDYKTPPKLTPDFIRIIHIEELFIILTKLHQKTFPILLGKKESFDQLHHIKKLVIDILRMDYLLRNDCVVIGRNDFKKNILTNNPDYLELDSLTEIPKIISNGEIIGSKINLLLQSLAELIFKKFSFIPQVPNKDSFQKANEYKPDCVILKELSLKKISSILHNYLPIFAHLDETLFLTPALARLSFICSSNYQLELIANKQFDQETCNYLRKKILINLEINFNDYFLCFDIEGIQTITNTLKTLIRNNLDIKITSEQMSFLNSIDNFEQFPSKKEQPELLHQFQTIIKEITPTICHR